MTDPIAGRGLGWLRDYPDFRDITLTEGTHARVLAPLREEEREKAEHMMDRVQAAVQKEAQTLPGAADLRQWCSPIEDQGRLGSCTAQAGVALVEYFERRAFGKHIDASRLFLYKVTRNLMRVTGDTGAFLRTTMKAMTLFGVPPEEYWPYDISGFDREPPAFCYAFAQNFEAIRYYRLDPPTTTPEDLLQRIKAALSTGLPSMFGFTVFSSIEQADDTGEIPYPTSGERTLGGHAVVAIGYDDGKVIRNTGGAGRESRGALMIRNSWGPGWGDQGYGWLPYDYVLTGLAVDWWSLLRNEWIDTEAFDF
jgi:C1A family cysteine protease